MIKHVGTTADHTESATMRAVRVFLALTMVAACGGGGGPVLYPNDAAQGGNSSGSGGSVVGTGGAVLGTGGGGGTSASDGGDAAGGTTGTGGTIGSGGATGTGGLAGQADGGDAESVNGLSVNPSSATFASTLVEAVSAPQTFTVSNGGNATAGTITALAAAFGGTNAADFLVTSNDCGTTLQVGASCEITVAFAPKTRSGSRSASLTVSAPLGATADVSLSGTALPSLGFLAGGLGGPGNLDGTGVAARFNYPAGIASDGAGNLYVTDWSSHTIRKVVIATGAVTTLAGAAGQYGGGDGTGANARFTDPYGIAVDGAGNLFVADSGNNAIRKVVIATGAVTTLAGSGSPDYGTADGTGAAARFNSPYGIASDGAGSLYVADTTNSTIRKVVIATGAVTTLAGAADQTGSADGTGAAASFDHPFGIVGDGAGNLYVADTNNGTIRKVVIATGAVTTLAGAAGQFGSADGTGAAASFASPQGITRDEAGNLFVTDGGGDTIRKIVIATGAVTTLAGAAGQSGAADGTGASSRFYAPAGIASDGAGNLFVADHNNHTLRKVVVATGAVTTLAGVPPPQGDSADGSRTAARFNWPRGVASDGSGQLYVADTNNHTIRTITLATGAVTTLAGKAGQPGDADATGAEARFDTPVDVASDGSGNLYVADYNNSKVRRIVVATGAVTTLAGSGGFFSVDGIGPAASFYWMDAVTADGAGNLFVADNTTIRKIVIATGAVTTLVHRVGTSPEDPASNGIATDGAGNLFFSDHCSIMKVALATSAVTTFAGDPYTAGSVDGTGVAARFQAPRAIASDGAGNLYVADGGMIRKIVIATAAVSTVIGSPGRVGVSLGALPASLNDVYGVAVLPTGELAIVDNLEGTVLIGHL
jgi:sugar lactone lactonase YvrE